MNILNRKRISLLLGLTIVLQLVISTAVLSKAWHTQATGDEILLRAEPVDPRSLFRGNYALISYEISTVTYGAFSTALLTAGDKKSIPTTGIVSGTKVYTVLRTDKNNIYHFDRVSLIPPTLKPGERFIQGRLTSRCDAYRQSELEGCSVKYGIEAYFAPKARALDLETRLRQGALSRIALTESGQAALLEIIAPPADH